MPAIARVVVDIALDREFDYLVPPELQPSAVVGARVRVPFGRRTATGFIVTLSDRSEHTELKHLAAVLDDAPLISEPVMALARWIASYYLATREQALRAVLPGAVRRPEAAFKKQRAVSLAPGRGEEPPPAGALPDKQEKILAALRASAPRLLSELTSELGITEAPVRSLERKGWVVVADIALARVPGAEHTVLPTEPLPLMPSQAEALRVIVQRMQAVRARDGATEAARGGHPSAAERHVVLLYGVTGSGKTEVYLQAIGHARRDGRGAIVLVPEISLTPQTVERFRSRFGADVAVLHSHLSDGERHDEWHRIRAGDARVVVGARSAVFAPVRRLGLIVVDEEHEPGYKQEEAPRYHARDVAVMRGRIEGCVVVLGSATPSLESWANARGGKYELVRLPERVDDRRMPAMQVVDMRVEMQTVGKAGILSRPLLDAMRLRLERAEQTLLFLNRRGYASSLLCPRCGFVAKCGNCSVAFTYHRTDEKMRCHICGEARAVPAACPECRDPSFRFAGVGTQRVEGAVAKIFPKARIRRLDADAATRKGAYDEILGDFRAGKTDILIGTQMIAKGLHFPNVTLVGIISADMGLHLPDFRAGERSFQLLAQVAGRAGRGAVPGDVIIQTHTPFHTAIQAARRLDFEGFTDIETEFRRELFYPPFSRLTCVTLRGTDEERVKACATAFHERLKGAVPDRTVLSEPCPAPLARAKGFYRYQVMLRGPSVARSNAALREVLSSLPLPRGVSIAVDVDACNLL